MLSIVIIIIIIVIIKYNKGVVTWVSFVVLFFVRITKLQKFWITLVDVWEVSTHMLIPILNIV